MGHDLFDSTRAFQPPFEFHHFVYVTMVLDVISNKTWCFPFLITRAYVGQTSTLSKLSALHCDIIKYA